MSIITFWNDTREQSGRTLTSVAVATRMAIERNSKILLISTSVADSTMKKCFWVEENKKNNFLGTKTSNIAVENGIEGLLKLVTSNKLTPSTITDYTKVVFKGRLEILPGRAGAKDKSIEENWEDFKKEQEYFADLIRVANQYYDIVIVDLDKMLSTKVKEDILKISDVD